MIASYYAAAVGAMRQGDDGMQMIRLHAMVIHPESDADPVTLAIEAARAEVMPESEGWSNHYAVVTPIAISISAIAEAEKAAVPGELRIVCIPMEHD